MESWASELWAVGERLNRSRARSWSCRPTHGAPAAFRTREHKFTVDLEPSAGGWPWSGGLTHPRMFLCHPGTRAPRQSTQPMFVFFLEGIEDGMFRSLF